MDITKEKVENLISQLKFKFPYSVEDWCEHLYLENYHCHKDFSNCQTRADSPSSINDYVKRVKELGGKCLYSLEHGFQGSWMGVYEAAENNNLKYRHSSEVYWVKDRHAEDKTNCHMCVIATNNKGKEDLNYILSIANEDGYYYKPRIDLDLLLSINPKNFIVTSACVAGWKYPDAEDIWLKIWKHFGDHFFLELQNHNTETQKKLNKKILSISKKYGIQIICGLDSHFIKPEDSFMRDQLLEYKGIHYEDEDGWYMDYPDTKEVIRRFEEQGVLTENEILTAILNTNIFVDGCEEIIIDKKFKIPTIYPNLTKEEKIKKYKQILNDAYKKEKLKSKEKAEGIRWEAQQIIESDTVDYMLTSQAILKLGVEKYGGILTTTSRGCFEGQALVHTKESFKQLKNVERGDLVLGDDGRWHKVLNTFKYDIEEDMMELEHLKQGSLKKKYNNICTTDHKILINRDGNISYIQAKDLKENDLLCSPIIKDIRNDIISYDLNDYNIFGYDYDDIYIYEKKCTNEGYKYSPRYIENLKIGVSNTFCKKIIDGYIPTKKNSIEKLNKLLSVTPFKTREQYVKYCKKQSFKIIKIPRYITLDSDLNAFIGMMYGDGWNMPARRVIGLAVNRTTKNDFNRKLFYKIAVMFNCNVGVNKSKTKNLDQLTINSHILSEWFSQEFFSSEKYKDKVFNLDLLNQNINMLKCLRLGLIKADGSVKKSRNQLCYDSTSLSLISIFSILDNIVYNDTCPLSLDVREEHTDQRGYHSKESYKLRRSISQIRPQWKVSRDDNYWFLPITKIELHKNKKTTVYDIEVENCHSYTINNIVVHNSAASYCSNKLLGFTTMDRFAAGVPIYPERFLTKERVLAGQMPD